jgi:hypothetical protein
LRFLRFFAAKFLLFAFRPPLFFLQLVHRRRFCSGPAVNNFLVVALEAFILQGDLSCSRFVPRFFSVNNRCISNGGQK